MKIYISNKSDPLLGDIRKHDLPFHLERDRWEFVDSIEQADVVPFIRPPIMESYSNQCYTLNDQLQLMRPYKNKIYLLMAHTHISESMGSKTTELYLNDYSELEKVYVVINNFVPVKKQISYNFCFNWVKAHFTEYIKHDLRQDRLWVAQCSAESFAIPNINKLTARKKFCIPNNVRLPDSIEYVEFKNHARDMLSRNINPEDSYYSDFRKNVFLMPEEDALYPSAYSGTENGKAGVGIIPISNKYFTDSIVSVFVESVGRFLPRSDCYVLALTEKTYIPLVKGHFILPYGSPGTIEELKKQGFLFPNWIDYNYDSIYDDDSRLKSFLDSFAKLQRMSLEELNMLANQDIEIRKHNRRVIVRSNYDFLYDKVKNLG